MVPSPDQVVVHPLVLLSVVDHYRRVAKDTKKRVVGVLLGEHYKGRTDVTNSFARERPPPSMHAIATLPRPVHGMPHRSEPCRTQAAIEPLGKPPLLSCHTPRRPTASPPASLPGASPRCLLLRCVLPV